MKKLISVVTLAFASLLMTAQELPKLSPLSKSENTVGVNKISLEYSRPSVRGRVIWGEVVPYNEVWRLGANACTKITCSYAMNFKSVESTRGAAPQVLPAGTYSIFAIPTAEGKWKVVFNSDFEQSGTANYDEAKNVVSLEITAKECAFTETLIIDISEITIGSGSIRIAWEKIEILIPFTVDTDATVEKNIQDAITAGKDLDKVYYNAANYFFNSKKDYATAISYVDKSIETKKAPNNVFLKARILYAQGETKSAMKLAEEALKMAEEAKDERWISYIGDTITAWKEEKK